MAAYADLAKVMGADLGRNVLRGVFKILIVGFLTPQAFGVLRSIYSFFRLVASAAELGLHHATVVFVSAAIRDDDDARKNATLKAVLLLKLVVFGTLLVAGNLAAPHLARLVFSDESLTVYIRLAFAAVGGQMLWRFITSYLTAHQQFGRLALYLVTMPLIMLVVAVVLILLDHFTLHVSILIYLFAPLATALGWWTALDLAFVKARGWDGAVIRRILGFSRWVFLSDVSSSARNHLNPLMLKNEGLSGSVAAGEVNAGLYSFGNDLASEITVFSRSLVTVLLPKASSMGTPRALRGFVKKSYLHLAALLVPLALLMFLAKPFLLLLGHFKPSYLDYLGSLEIFMILYAGSLFSVALIPINTALYAMRLPQVETYVGLFTLVILVAGGIVLIPVYGAKGAAIMLFIQRMITFLVLLPYGLVKLRGLQALGDEPPALRQDGDEEGAA
jgi:O-antigen/teichoic acid export membrane protein